MIQTFTVCDNAVFRRNADLNIYMTPDDCDRLLARYREVASDPHDYWRAEAAELGRQLAEAMRAAGSIHERQAA